MNRIAMLVLRAEIALICVLMLLGPFSTIPSTAFHQTRIAHELALPPYAYKNYSAIRSALYELQNEHPNICKVYDIGDSWQKLHGSADRDILALKISDNVALNEDEPQVLVLALEHAREWISSELALAVAENLTSAYGTNPQASWLIDNREIWIVPVVNPDGLDYSLAHDEWWRKNMRDNGDGTFGVDINRNFGGAMNGDPAGDWGGAGSSHTTSDEIYCGPAPFSEPETQALRDLVLSHRYQIAIDLHSYSDWVMWPWGYSSALPPDNGDLVRIGQELAAVNAYFPSQSVGLYPTTGDSLDWLYGGAGVYPFCFEVGAEFHPLDPTIALGTINRNIPAVLEGIELSGDRQERQFNITHDAVPARGYTLVGFNISAEITAARGVNTSATDAVYRIGVGPWKEVPMTRGPGNDTYFSEVPALDVGSVVDYYLVSSDLGGAVMESPLYAPYAYHSFTITPSPYDLPPRVTHEPKGEFGSNDTVFLSADGIQIIAHVTDDHGIRAVVLRYRAPGDSEFSRANMSRADPHNFSAVLPSSLDSGAEYFIEVTDTAGQKVRAPSDAPVSPFISNNAPPRIDPAIHFSVSEVIADSADKVTVSVNLTDDFGVHSAKVILSRFGVVIHEVPLILASGTPRNGTWIANVTVDSPAGILEVGVMAQDGRATTYVNGTSLRVAPPPHRGFESIAIILILAGVAGIVAVALVIRKFNRARRS